jgi:hypothetical protein
MLVVTALLAALLFGMWVRMKVHRRRFDRAFARATSAQRATSAFHKLLALFLVLAALWVFVTVHGR